jgi:hypothetical protein
MKKKETPPSSYTQAPSYRIGQDLEFLRTQITHCWLPTSGASTCSKQLSLDYVDAITECLKQTRYILSTVIGLLVAVIGLMCYFLMKG